MTLKKINIGSISFTLNCKTSETERKLEQIQKFIENKIKIMQKKLPNQDFDYILAAMVLEILDEYWTSIKSDKKISNKGSLVDKMDILNEKIKEKIEELDENMGKF